MRPAYGLPSTPASCGNNRSGRELPGRAGRASSARRVVASSARFPDAAVGQILRAEPLGVAVGGLRLVVEQYLEQAVAMSDAEAGAGEDRLDRIAQATWVMAAMTNWLIMGPRCMSRASRSTPRRRGSPHRNPAARPRGEPSATPPGRPGGRPASGGIVSGDAPPRRRNGRALRPRRACEPRSNRAITTSMASGETAASSLRSCS